MARAFAEGANVPLARIIFVNDASFCAGVFL